MASVPRFAGLVCDAMDTMSHRYGHANVNGSGGFSEDPYVWRAVGWLRVLKGVIQKKVLRIGRLDPRLGKTRIQHDEGGASCE